jgi:hypothetical protein
VTKLNHWKSQHYFHRFVDRRQVVFLGMSVAFFLRRPYIPHADVWLLSNPNAGSSSLLTRFHANE